MAAGIAAAALTVLWAAQLRAHFSGSVRPDFGKLVKIIWLLGGFLLGAYLLRQSLDLYSAWLSSPLARYLVPPYRSPAYFLTYVLWRIWSGWILALLAAYLAKLAADFSNRRAGGRFFRAEEPWLFAAAVFFCGWPGFLLYFLVLGAAAVLLVLVYRLRRKGRAPLYFLWLPAALFAILIMYGLLPAALLLKFNL